MPEADLDVAVIGAGAAGLAAAAALARRGLSVRVLEARERAGGRLWTLRGPALPVPVELGAEFIHGRPKATWDLVARKRLRAVELSGARYFSSAQGLSEGNGFWDKIGGVLGRLSPRRRDRSFDEACAALRLPEADARLARDFVEGFHAADAARISANDVAAQARAAEETEEDRLFRLEAGYDALIQALLRELPPGALRLETPVSRVRWSRSGAVLETPRGRLRARRVIVAVPLGVLQAGTPRLIPEPPGLDAALGALASGSVVKLVLVFAGPVWERAAAKALFLHFPGQAFPTWWTASPKDAPVLTAWAGGPRARALLAQGPAACLNQALGILGAGLKMPRGRLSAQLVSWHLHDWDADPWARGAYSYCLTGGMSARRALARTAGGTVSFAGEWLDSAGQNATVAGALASGFSAAAGVCRAARRGRDFTAGRRARKVEPRPGTLSTLTEPP